METDNRRFGKRILPTGLMDALLWEDRQISMVSNHNSNAAPKILALRTKQIGMEKKKVTMLKTHNGIC